MSSIKTIVGNIDGKVLSFTVGNDILLDKKLVDFDCISTAAHAYMLMQLPKNNPIITKEEFNSLLISLNKIIELIEKPQNFISDLAVVGIYYFKDISLVRP